jgi:hypothetical protein
MILISCATAAYSVLDEDLERLRFGAYDSVMASTDPLFHSFLYDWFVVKQRQDQLLEVSVQPSGDLADVTASYTFHRSIPAGGIEASR